MHQLLLLPLTLYGHPNSIQNLSTGVADHILQEDLKEDLEDTAGLLVDQAEDLLVTAPPGQALVRPSRDSLVSETAEAGFLTEFLEQLQPLAVGIMRCKYEEDGEWRMEEGGG